MRGDPLNKGIKLKGRMFELPFLFSSSLKIKKIATHIKGNKE